jgi:hypothetical protein
MINTGSSQREHHGLTEILGVLSNTEVSFHGNLAHVAKILFQCIKNHSPTTRSQQLSGKLCIYHKISTNYVFFATLRY